MPLYSTTFIHYNGTKIAPFTGGGVVTGPSLNGQNATQLSPRVDEEGNEILNEEGNEGGRQRNTPPANGSERGTSDGTAGGDDFDGTRDVDLETFATPRSVPSKSPSNTIRTALANQGRQTKSPKGHFSRSCPSMAKFGHLASLSLYSRYRFRPKNGKGRWK